MAASSKKPQARNVIGKRVREARQIHSPPLTQDQLSGKLATGGLQLDRVAIAKMETGTRCAFDYEVCALARALKVDARWLLVINGSSRPSQRAGGIGKRRV